MALTLDENGLSVQDLNEVIELLQTEYKAIYGADIILDQDTPDGQLISILSKLNADAQANLLQLYNSFDPDSAVGVQLNKIIKLSAITRLPASKSTVNVNLTASTQVTLGNDYTVVDVLGQSWIIQQSQTILAGTTLVEFEAVDYGSIAAAPNTITEQGTILTQITNVNNPNAASVGIDEETDVELRQRRDRSLEKPAYSTVGGLVGELLNTENVIDCIVYENSTSVEDTVRNILPHTIWVIVDGGLQSDIVEVIAKEKTAGCGLKGNISDTYLESFTRTDGTTRIHTHDVKFDRPITTNIYIKLDVSLNDVGGTIDTDLIKEKLTLKLFNIAEDLTVTELYGYIYQAGVNFSATNLQASKDDITYVVNILDADYDEKFIITTDNITITEI